MQEAISFQHEEKIPLKIYFKNVLNENQLYLPSGQSVQLSLKLKDYILLSETPCGCEIAIKQPNRMSYQCNCKMINIEIGIPKLYVPIVSQENLSFESEELLDQKCKERYNEINKELELVHSLENILNTLKNNLDLINIKSNKRKSHCLNIENKILNGKSFPTALFLYDICTTTQYHDIVTHVNKYFNLDLDPDNDREKIFIYFAFWNIIQNVISYKNLLNQAIECIKSNNQNVHPNVMFNNIINDRIKLLEDDERIQYYILDNYLDAVDNKTKQYLNTYKLCFEKATKKWNIYPGFSDKPEEVDIEQFKTNFRKKLEHNQLLQKNGF